VACGGKVIKIVKIAKLSLLKEEGKKIVEPLKVIRGTLGSVWTHPKPDLLSIVPILETEPSE
jgi:hypothetical protein